jgi:hypothetical protein
MSRRSKSPDALAASLVGAGKQHEHKEDKDQRALRSHITPQAIELFKRGMLLQRLDLDEIWEEEGGRCREYRQLCVALRIALGIPLGEPCPLDDVDEDGSLPDWMTDPVEIRRERKAIALRKALLQTIGDFSVEVPDALLATDPSTWDIATRAAVASAGKTNVHPFRE